MRQTPRALLAAGGLGLASLYLAACGGGGGLLSSAQSGSLSTQLDQVSTAVSSGQCASATSAASGLRQAVDNLTGTGIKRQLIANLQQGADTVKQLAAADCHTQTSSTSSSSSTSSPTSTSSTTISSSTPTSASTPSSSTASSTSSATPASSTDTSTATSSGNGGAGLPGGGSAGGSGGGAP